ncbi:hypothetical protein CLV62_13021 [Dysgonomonas alginatilytica]|uniref:Uncharacterized protein n=1 Tax=Dysgonomonas alginatilytica TaxID=1605892 RepID=A0A2V3PJB6_9BACT|nr:hypothetical protein [Dysgonomonas alginatilytica]PXV60173.1 hypothetical protein CLV62_13021 [Dysgonomonas alginatilytica]
MAIELCLLICQLNVFGFVFARNEYNPLSVKIATYEAIHTLQMKELLYVFFYVWYGLEWLIRLIQYRNTKEAYRNISFEREAYNKQCDSEYLKNRKMYSYWRYI